MKKAISTRRLITLCELSMASGKTGKGLLRVSKGRPKKKYELYMYGEYERTGYINDLADVVGMKAVLLRKRVNKEMSGILLKPIESKPPEYAFYKGEDGPYIGTLASIPELTGITEYMLEWDR